MKTILKLNIMIILKLEVVKFEFEFELLSNQSIKLMSSLNLFALTVNMYIYIKKKVEYCTSFTALDFNQRMFALVSENQVLPVIKFNLPHTSYAGGLYFFKQTNPIDYRKLLNLQFGRGKFSCF